MPLPLLALLTSAESAALGVSVKVSLVAVACSLPLAVAVAWLLARREFPGKLVIETLVNLPLVLPPVVTGYLLLVVFGHNGLLGSWLAPLGLRFVFDWKGAALASGVVAFPLLVGPIRLAFAATDPRLAMVARTLGASRLDAFCTVTLPLAAYGIVAGSVLAFARCMGEFGATIMIAGSIEGQTQTVPLYLYELLESPLRAHEATRLLVASVVVAALALMVGGWMERRGKARIARAGAMPGGIAAGTGGSADAAAGV